MSNINPRATGIRAITANDPLDWDWSEVDDAWLDSAFHRFESFGGQRGIGEDGDWVDVDLCSLNELGWRDTDER